MELQFQLASHVRPFRNLFSFGLSMGNSKKGMILFNPHFLDKIVLCDTSNRNIFKHFLAKPKITLCFALASLFVCLSSIMSYLVWLLIFLNSPRLIFSKYSLIVFAVPFFWPLTVEAPTEVFAILFWDKLVMGEGVEFLIEPPQVIRIGNPESTKLAQ